jgi:uncharacterized BrkB/YihY/UPF0761 family membrane protein
VTALALVAVALVCACVLAVVLAARSVALAWLAVREREIVSDERLETIRADVTELRKAVRDAERAAAVRPRVRA